jgi:Flp pilus assembly protein TadG
MITKRENGQAMVLTILFLAGLLGMAALVLDVGSWFREKRQLQLTADASALAGAQVLPGSPSGATSLAIQYAQTNGRPVTSNDVAITSDLSSNDSITVQAKSVAPGFFSKLFGINTVNVGATATARAGFAAQALYVAPMVVSKFHPLLMGGTSCPCYGQETTLDFGKMGAPGAFGMLNLIGGNGTVGSSELGDEILKGFDKYLGLGLYRSDPGAKFNSSNIQSALDARLGSVLLFPVYDSLSGNGQNAEYNIIGWVGFHLDGYDTHGNVATLTGYFTQFIAKGIQATSGTTQPDFGVRVIQLVK